MSIPVERHLPKASFLPHQEIGRLTFYVEKIMKKIKFKNVKGYYTISEYGDVVNIKTGRTLKPSLDTKGYKQVSLRTKTGKITVKIHKLVAIHYIGKRLVGKTCVNHKDGKKPNTHYKNLEWSTTKDNAIHASKNGLLKPYSGTNHRLAKLKDSDIPVIADLSKNHSIHTISKMYDLDYTTIKRVVLGESWKHVNPLTAKSANVLYVKEEG